MVNDPTTHEKTKSHLPIGMAAFHLCCPTYHDNLT